ARSACGCFLDNVCAFCSGNRRRDMVAVPDNKHFTGGTRASYVYNNNPGECAVSIGDCDWSHQPRGLACQIQSVCGKHAWIGSGHGIGAVVVSLIRDMVSLIRDMVSLIRDMVSVIRDMVWQQPGRRDSFFMKHCGW